MAEPFDPGLPSLDASDFWCWLKERVDQVVGVTCDSCQCPLARWLSSRYGGPFLVDGVVITLADGRPLAAPDWVASFVLRLDGRLEAHSEVVGMSALDIMDEVLMQMEGGTL